MRCTRISHSHSYSRNAFASSAQLSIALEQIATRAGGEAVVSFGATLWRARPAGAEYENECEEEGRDGRRNKHLGAPQARIIFRDFFEMRRRRGSGRPAGREEITLRFLVRPFASPPPLSLSLSLSLVLAPFLCFFSLLARVNFDDFPKRSCVKAGVLQSTRARLLAPFSRSSEIASTFLIWLLRASSALASGRLRIATRERDGPPCHVNL